MSRAGRASARIGTRVPSAVVLSATPSSQASASRPAWCKTRPIAMPIASEIAQPIVPRTSERRATRCSINSRPAKKNRNTRPRLARKSMWLSISARSKPLGTDQDPEHDLQHDCWEHDPVVEPRQNRSGTRRQRGRARATQRPAPPPPRRAELSAITLAARERSPTCWRTSRPARVGSPPRLSGTRSAGRSWARRRGCAG